MDRRHKKLKIAMQYLEALIERENPTLTPAQREELAKRLYGPVLNRHGISLPEQLRDFLKSDE